MQKFLRTFIARTVTHRRDIFTTTTACLNLRYSVKSAMEYPRPTLNSEIPKKLSSSALTAAVHYSAGNVKPKSLSINAVTTTAPAAWTLSPN
jgi:hypothetical protein